MKVQLILCLFLSSLITTDIFADSPFFVFNKQRDPQALLNQYYHLKSTDPATARKVLEILLVQYPNNLTGLLEMGYWYSAKIKRKKL